MEREVMKLSESLFVPSLNMRWKWLGTSFELWMGETLIWTSITGAVPWDYPSANCVAKVLLEYLNTPVVDLKSQNIAHVTKSSGWHDELSRKNFDLLPRLLLAADRRIGKNIQSLRLFTEPDIRVRNIIGRRV